MSRKLAISLPCHHCSPVEHRGIVHQMDLLEPDRPGRSPQWNRGAGAFPVLAVQIQGQMLPKPNKAVLLGALNYALLVTLFIAANKLTTSANAILLQFTAPVWVLLIGWLFYKEKISRRDILTVVAVFAGMILFFIGDLEIGNMVGNILAIIKRSFLGHHDSESEQDQGPQADRNHHLGKSADVPDQHPVPWKHQLEPKAVGSILFLGIFQLGLAYVFYTSGIQRVTAIEGILIPVLEPLLNPVWVFIGIGERPSAIALVGGVIVMAAVVIRNVSYARGARAEKRAEPSQQDGALTEGNASCNPMRIFYSSKSKTGFICCSSRL